MRSGHADAQYLFDRLGRKLGYETRRSWTRELPTDGVWLLPGTGLLLPACPAVAIEVAVTEGPKAMKGSIDTLAEVSPALGILLINDVEIRRGETRKGTPEEVTEDRLRERIKAATDRALRTQQRIEVWTYDQLQQRYRVATGDRTPAILGRLTNQHRS